MHTAFFVRRPKINKNSCWFSEKIVKTHIKYTPYKHIYAQYPFFRRCFFLFASCKREKFDFSDCGRVYKWQWFWIFLVEYFRVEEKKVKQENKLDIVLTLLHRSHLLWNISHPVCFKVYLDFYSRLLLRVFFCFIRLDHFIHLFIRVCIDNRETNEKKHTEHDYIHANASLAKTTKRSILYIQRQDKKNKTK